MTRTFVHFSRAGCLLIAAVLAHSTTRAAETLLINGHIYTGDSRQPQAEAIVINGDHIVAVGANAAIRSRRSSGAQIIDLHGHTVLPGFIDSHTHMLFGSLELHAANLSLPEHSITPATPDLLVERVRAYATSHPDEKVIVGRADFSTVAPMNPTFALLDRVDSNRPIVIHNVGEHALWVNSKALEIAGVTDQPLPDPIEEKGVMRDAEGRPLGVMLEAAQETIERAVLPMIPREEKLTAIREAAHYFNSFGVTSIVNATGSLDEIELYGTLRDRGQLTVRTRTSFGAVAVPHRLTPQFLSDLETARTRFHDDWVSANLVKFFSDGGTGMWPPLVYTYADYRHLVTELDKRGFQIMTHATRPDTEHMVLDTYATLEQANGKRDRRLRIEHNDSVLNADVPRLGALGVSASMQPNFCCSSSGTAGLSVPEASPTDRWHSILHDGGMLAFGSDWPCTFPPDPLVGIEEATTREAWQDNDIASVLGNPFEGGAQAGATKLGGSAYAPEEKLTVSEAVAAYTSGSAYAAFADNRGRLEAGKLADLIVLSKDIFSIPPETIGSARVVMTMVGGKVVFGQDP